MDNLEPLLIPYYLSCIEAGYVYECSCGGLHKTEEDGLSCMGCSDCLGDHRLLEPVRGGFLEVVGNGMKW